MVGAVHVVATLGTSVLEIVRVEAGDAFACPLVPFPLVRGEPDGVVVVRPIGSTATNRGVPIEGTTVRVAEGDAIEIVLGLVTITVRPAEARGAPLAKRRVERRPYIYGAVVLVAHLALWGAAEATWAPPLEKLPAPLPPLRAHVAHVADDPPAVAAVASPAPVVTPDTTPKAGHHERRRGGRGARGRTADTGEGAMLGSFGSLSMLIPSVDVGQLAGEAQAYDEGAAEAARFGGSSGHFDPLAVCTTNCGTIAAGPYETLSFQNRPRPVPRMAIASSDAALRAAVARAQSSLAACYATRALDGDVGTVHVELEASDRGEYSVRRAHGLDTVGPCVGKMIESVIDGMDLRGKPRATASITIAFSFEMRRQ